MPVGMGGFGRADSAAEAPLFLRRSGSAVSTCGRNVQPCLPVTYPEPFEAIRLYQNHRRSIRASPVAVFYVSGLCVVFHK